MGVATAADDEMLSRIIDFYPTQAFVIWSIQVSESVRNSRHNSIKFGQKCNGENPGHVRF